MPPMPRSARSRMKPRCYDDGAARPAGPRIADGPGDGVLVASIRRRTPAASAGLIPGDRILAVNGAPLRDAIDFQFHAGDDHLELTVARDGTLTALALERRGRDLGLELAAPTPDEISTCANKCVFCFIHQLPRG